MKYRAGCSIKCSLTPACRSFNFCGHNICQLLSVDEFSLDETDPDSQRMQEASCVNVALQLYHFPDCNATTEDASACGLQSKSGVKWDTWRFISAFNVTETTWMQNAGRHCIAKGSTVVNGSMCEDGSEEEAGHARVEHMQIQNSSANYDEASEYCANGRGHLWGDLDIPHEHYLFIFDKFLNLTGSPGVVMLAVTDMERDDTWVNSAEEDVTHLINWAPNEPLGGDVLTMRLRTFDSQVFFDDINRLKKVQRWLCVNVL